MSDDRSALEAEVKAHPFLIGMSEHQVRLLIDSAMQTRFDAGAKIFGQGETANRFYLIQRGTVILESDTPEGKVEIDRVSGGDLLGWSWLFPPYVWYFTARALDPTVALFFYGTVLRDYCEKDHSLGYELFKRMSEVMTRRLQSARTRLLKAYAGKQFAESEKK